MTLENLKSMLFLILLVPPFIYANSPVEKTERVTGIVFSDNNSSLVFDEGDRPLKDVPVSNGTDVVLTDSEGRYELNINGDAQIFVIKPRDYHSPVNKNNLPQFYYLHRPNGSPAMEFAGISPTGPLPASVNFPLIEQKEPDEFNVIVFGDPQVTNIKEIEYAMSDALEELAAQDVRKSAAFGISLGDIANNNLDVFEPFSEAVSQIDLPWFNVIGNHDINADAPDAYHGFDSFQRVFGPAYYAFNYGPVHFVVLNSMMRGNRDRRYNAGLSDEQIEFVQRDLKLVPKDKLVVFLMHIPVVYSDDWNDSLDAFQKFIKERPNTLSLAAHTHTHTHFFIDKEGAAKGAKQHHHITHGTLCGSWWLGIPDEYGIPSAIMTDGTPNGYGTLSIKGNTYTHRYKALRKSADFQMHIDSPQSIIADNNEPVTISANIFNAWPNAKVTMRIDRAQDTTTMERTIRKDPLLEAYIAADELIAGRTWKTPDKSKPCFHLWSARLPDLSVGTHLIEIDAQNPDGQVFRGARIVRVEN